MVLFIRKEMWILNTGKKNNVYNIISTVLLLDIIFLFFLNHIILDDFLTYDSQSQSLVNR